MNKRGVILLILFMVISVLLTLGAGFVVRVVSENNAALRYVDSINAFWLAEAGIAQALAGLRADYSLSGSEVWTGTLSQGNYSVDVEIMGERRRVVSRGFAPLSGPVRAIRIIEAVIGGGIPEDFYDKTVYSAGDIQINGTSFSIEGDVVYSGDLDVQQPENISGDVEYDAEIDPLALFDFDEARAISITQGNLYNQARLDAVKNGEDSFPSSFWFTEPTDPEDPTTGVPNLVYIESDLQLNGNIGSVGGLFLVVGDVVTNPGAQEDLTINGNGQIEGVIYTRGTFRINGGGGGLNVNGGVWAGQETRINGNAHLAFNQDYMLAIESLDIGSQVQIVSWRDTQNPFQISP